MKKELLKEIKQILEQSKVRAIDFPIPSYLFMQKYGRSIKKEMKEVTKVLGESEWFFFQTLEQNTEESLRFRFQRQEEQNAGLGKVFKGCVLIEVSGEEDEKEWNRLLEYLEEQKGRIRCFFTTKNLQEENRIRECLERYFFVRVLKAEEFNREEQQGFLEETLEEYGFFVTEETKIATQNFFEQRRWKETEDVEKSIRNLAKNLVYERMLNSSEIRNSIELREWERILKIKGDINVNNLFKL